MTLRTSIKSKHSLCAMSYLKRYAVNKMTIFKEASNGRLLFNDHPVDNTRECSPEQRLWMAVIELTFVDSREIIKKQEYLHKVCISNKTNKKKQATRSFYKALESKLNSIKADISSDYFECICDMADLDVKFIRDHLKFITTTSISLTT